MGGLPDLESGKAPTPLQQIYCLLSMVKEQVCTPVFVTEESAAAKQGVIAQRLPVRYGKSTTVLTVAPVPRDSIVHATAAATAVTPAIQATAPSTDLPLYGGPCKKLFCMSTHSQGPLVPAATKVGSRK